MQIQINTDHNIDGREALAAQVSGTIETALSRFSDHITRVEVHLSDENGGKNGLNDKRCMLEARLERHRPITVTDEAPPWTKPSPVLPISWPDCSEHSREAARSERVA